MEIKGKIILALPEVTGTSKAGNPWKKKEYVLEYLNKKGFTVDYDTIDNLIENAVLELNAKK